MRFGIEAWRTFERGCEREWLVTNGIGGYASGTIIGANTRRYHGLLVAALKPPARRFLLLAGLDERIESAGVYYNLATNHTAGGVTESGYVHLQRVVIDPFPEFTYCFGNILLRKLIFMPYGVNATVILYRIYNGGSAARITLAPMVNCRGHHGNSFKGEIGFRQEPVSGGVTVHGGAGSPPLILQSSKGKFYASPDWFYGMHYPAEAERGLNPWEDHFLPGRFDVTLPAEKETVFTVTAAAGEGLDPASAGALLSKEKERFQKLEKDTGLNDPFALDLARAADAFIVKRAATGSATVVAGYPWFTDWGRDAMIALPGLCLITGRYTEAREILTLFGSHLRGGLLPNLFPEGGGEPLYNTVDAALWYFQAVHKYFEYTADEDFVLKKMLPVLTGILNHYAEGTHFGIRMDSDGLIQAGDPGIQLTWMDAKVGGWVVTPRHGKAVEINALWYNAVCIIENLYRHFGLAFPFTGLSDRVRSGFNAFWCPDGYLYDVLRSDGSDPAIRPNQIFAVSLPYSPLEPERARAVVHLVEQELYTPYGLRSLSTGDPAYKGRYTGDVKSRDAAYHQGTVWSWLLGPFVTAYRKVHGQSVASRERARAFIAPFIDHIGDHGVGYVSEIFDGDAPHWPRGCFAQAWGVAEILRAYVEDVLEADKGKNKKRQRQ
ncbi:MAG: amylo-alpha-1,6-glucosidase [Bacillota bacterium]